jgi:hypothetical protein
MAIDQDQLYLDTITFLPDSNVLDEATVRAINASVVTNQIPADDDQYYSEALCKCLRANAIVNASKYTVDDSGKKREKVGQVEIEMFEGTNKDVWKDYLDSLRDLCPLLPGGGYLGLPSTRGILVNPSDPVIVNPCPDTTEFHL